MTVEKFVKYIMDKNGKNYQFTIAMEEMSELIKELSKNIRGEKKRNEIAEEAADVFMCLKEIFCFFDIDELEIQQILHQKIEKYYKVDPEGAKGVRR